jgi:hypothetical protein
VIWVSGKANFTRRVNLSHGVGLSLPGEDRLRPSTTSGKIAWQRCGRDTIIRALAVRVR